MNHTTLLLKLAAVLGLLSLLSLTTNQLQATHFAGGEITYQHVSGNTYDFTLKFYRDCQGISAPSSTIVNGYTGGVQRTRFTLSKTIFADITPVCISGADPCQNGQPGIEEHTYTARVTLPPSSQPWVFGYGSCCRNDGIQNLTNSISEGWLITARLNPNQNGSNSSPQFFNPPVVFLCAGQPATISPNATDPDGTDVLSYSLGPCFDNSDPRSPRSVAYATGYSGSNPLPTVSGINLNPSSGQLTFTPSAAGNYVICIRVTETRNGVVVGEVIRDIQVQIASNCNNTVPAISAIGDELVFPGDNVSILVSVSDADGDNLTVTASAPTGFSGILSGTGTPGSYSGTYDYAATQADEGSVYSISINAADDACPLPGTASETFRIAVPRNCNDKTVNGAVTDASCDDDGAIDLDLSNITNGGALPVRLIKWTFPDGSSSNQEDIANLAPGTYSVQVVDGSSNVCAYQATFTVGRGNPITAVDCPANQTVNADANCTYTLGDITGGVTVTGGCPPIVITQTPSAGSGLALGSNTVTVTASDAFSNGGCFFIITVEDNTPPTISCPANITQMNDAGVCGAAVNFASTANDNCDGDVSGDISCVDAAGDAVASGDFFPVGTTTITCSVSDSRGNGPATCSFDITVTAVGDRDCDGVFDVCDVCDGGDDRVDNNGDGIPDCSQLFSDINNYHDDWICHRNRRKIFVCHNGRTICINFNALPAHIGRHGGQPGSDPIGPCVSCNSQSRSVQAPAGVSLNAYPNPAGHFVNLEVNGLEAASQLRIFDELGRTVFNHSLAEGEKTLRIDVEKHHLSNGVYTLYLSSGDLTLTKRLMIVK